MSKEELSFEELPDGSKIITIQGINQFGEKYIRQERIKCPSVWDALKRLTYTADDMEAFAEWCRIEGFFYEVDNKIWCNYDTEPITEKTTTQLREDWEAKQKGELAYIPVKQKCPKCGDESYNSNVNYCLNSNCSLFFI